MKKMTKISYGRSRVVSLCLLWVDAKKAFDQVHWGFLQLVLALTGLGQATITRILELYSPALAQVTVKGSLSSPFTIYKTRLSMVSFTHCT